MESRGNQVPMDFAYQDGIGPVDPSSAFRSFAMNNEKKRTFSAFDSPLKSPPQQLRPPNDQPYFFTQSSNNPFRSPSFQTPRKPVDVDFSSPGEESSPASQADNEETPDTTPVNMRLKDVKASSKRNSLFGMYGRFAPPGSAKSRKGYADGIAKRMHKKRRRAEVWDQQSVQGRRSSDETSEEDVHPGPKSTKKQSEEVGWIAGLFAFIHKYPDAPSIIAKYLQVFFNAAILAGCLYMFWSFYSTIQADVNRASEDAMAEVLAEMATCSKNFVENRCGADSRPPALENVCGNWELCMNRDPSAVKRARLSAHTFAEIFNSFVEPISLKTMLFTSTLVMLGLLVNNATFTLFRRFQEHHFADAYRQPSNPYMNPAIQGAGAPQYGPTQGLHYGQPQTLDWHGDHGQQAAIEWTRSPSKEHRARSRSPEKHMIR